MDKLRMCRRFIKSALVSSNSTFNSSTGITTSYTYKPNTNDISTETVTRNLSPVTLAVYSYTYRSDGLKTGETDTTYNSDGTVNDTRTLSWQYDGLDRVTQETSSDTAGTAALNYTDLYQYDLNSNRTTETIENGSGTATDTITSSYNADNQLKQSVDANNGTTTYSYDSNGSQTDVSSPTGTTTSEYTLQDRLAGIQNKNSSGTVTSSAAYIYDDQGNRIEVITVTGSNAPVTTYDLVDGNNPTGYAQIMGQSQTPGTPTVSYVWGLNLIAQNNAAGTPNAGTYYFVVDAHGSTRLLLNSAGDVVQAYNYDSSGDAIGFTPTSAITNYLYDQQYYDVISGQYYMRARNYDPATGTFTQQDRYAINPGDLANANLYLYAGADAVNIVDPSGHASIVEVTVSLAINASLTGAVTGAVIGAGNGLLSVENGGSFLAGFAGGFIDGFAIGASLFAAFDLAGPAGVAKAIAIGTVQGAASLASTTLADVAQTKSLGNNQLRQAFLAGFAGGVASVGLGGGFSSAFGLTDNSVASLALSASASGLAASITDLTAGLENGEGVRQSLAHALFAGGINVALTVFGDTFAGTIAGNTAESAVKEVLAQGIGFVIGVPVGTLLGEQRG